VLSSGVAAGKPCCENPDAPMPVDGAVAIELAAMTDVWRTSSPPAIKLMEVSFI
jgi:hypothetical protein